MGKSVVHGAHCYRPPDECKLLTCQSGFELLFGTKSARLTQIPILTPLANHELHALVPGKISITFPPSTEQLHLLTLG